MLKPDNEVEPEIFTRPDTILSAPDPRRTLSRTALGAVSSTSTAKRTYSGARSFRPDVQDELIFARLPGNPSVSSSSPGPDSRPSESWRKLGLPALPLAVKDRESYAALRKRFGADDDEELEFSQGVNDLKSVTQQRAKGVNVRFQDEFSFLTEGLSEDEPIGVRRSR